MNYIIRIFLSGLKKNTIIFITIILSKNLNNTIVTIQKIKIRDYYKRLISIFI